ncbi:MAG: SHOCT domain-containing protein [Rhodobacteraceae bacterium]|nr:SHOCT domain-containing protein [Paracoccaceae bacterium]
MMWGGGLGMAGGLMMLLFWGAIIALIVFAVRGFSTGPGSGSRSDAAEILRERYAKGEIDDDEYERRKAQLEK